MDTVQAQECNDSHQEAVVEVDDEFQNIEKLETLGVNRGDIKKAKDAGYNTAESILMATSKVLSEIKGLSDNKVQKLVEAASKLCPTINSFMTAKQIEEQRERQIVHISTGSQALDDILEGGIETKSITEMYGEYRCGKTQLCHTLAVTSQINAQNPGKVAWIDTEGAFRPKRIRAIAARFGVDPDSVLDNVNVVRVATWEHQMAVLEPLAAMMADQPYKLVIMDSISACFRTDFSGRGELADRQQKLGQMLAKLRKLAEEYNIAIFVTNQVMSDPSGGALFVSDPKKAVGGHVMAHGSTVRLSVRKGKAEQRLMKVVQAPHLPEAEASFCISNDGIIDYKD